VRFFLEAAMTSKSGIRSALVVMALLAISPWCLAAGGGGGADGGGGAGGSGGASGASGAGEDSGSSSGTGGAASTGPGSPSTGGTGAAGSSANTSGGANATTLSPRGTTRLGSGPGGSNPIGTTSTNQGGTHASTVDPNSPLNNPQLNPNPALPIGSTPGNAGSGAVAPSQNGQPANSFNAANPSATLGTNQSGTTANSDWRQVYYENRWWYYTTQNNWLYYDNGQWNPYLGASRRYSTGYRGTAATNGSGATTSNVYRGSAAVGPSAAATGARPTGPTEAQLRALEQQYFSAGPVNSGYGVNALRPRTNTAQPGMGVDTTGVPIEPR
jgi:hypothetical protein